MNMNVAMWSSFFYEINPEDAVRELKKCGFNCAELSSEHAEMLLQRGDAAVEGARFKAFCQQENFSTPQGHFSQDVNLATENEAEAEQAVELLKKWCDLFEAAGVRYGVLHDIALPIWKGEKVNNAVSHFNAIWQGSANEIALRSLGLAANPVTLLNVTGPETVSTEEVAEANTEGSHGKTCNILVCSERYRQEAEEKSHKE